MLVAMERHPALVITAVNGDFVAGGAEYALSVDAVLAAHHARIGFSEIRQRHIR
jgi:enoyl-CoA hydratase/carnithine racemase